MSSEEDFEPSPIIEALRGAPNANTVVRTLANDGRLPVRLTAVELAVKVLPPQDAATVLADLVATDKSADVRDAATQLLADIPGADLSQVVSSLRKRLESPGSQIELLFAIWAVARFRDSASVPSLEKLADSYQWPPGRRAARVAAAVISGQHRGILERLVAHDHEWRAELTVAAGLIGTPEAGTALDAWAKEAPDVLCRELAKWALEKYILQESRGSGNQVLWRNPSPPPNDGYDNSA